MAPRPSVLVILVATIPFSRSAHLYDAIHGHRRDYEAQADAIAAWIHERNNRASSLLDVACGTGLHLSHLRRVFDVAGVDISDAMIAIARTRNPGIAFQRDDMRTFQFGRHFDAVICMFSSITYAGSVDHLNETLRNFASHLNPSGVCIVEPYKPLSAWRDHGRRGLRTAEVSDLTVALVDRAVRAGRHVRREIAYAVATADAVEVIREDHQFALFTRPEYEQAFTAAGFNVTFDVDGFDPTRGMYVGTLP